MALDDSYSKVLLHFDGAISATVTPGNFTISNSDATTVSIGEYANQYLNGLVDEFRISKGIARWTDTFTPPSSQYGVSETPIHILYSFMG